MHANLPITKAMSISIFLHQPNGIIINLDVHIRDTISDVKQQVRDKQGIPMNRQRLIFDGIDLEDDSMLLEHGIQQGATLQLVLFLQLFVHTSAQQTFIINADDSYTLLDIKAEIEILDGVSTDRQRLFFRDTELLLDDVSLGQYGIDNGSTLILVRILAIFVESSGQLMSMDVDDNATIGSLQAVIQDRFSISVDRQDLVVVHRTW